MCGPGPTKSVSFGAISQYVEKIMVSLWKLIQRSGWATEQPHRKLRIFIQYGANAILSEHVRCALHMYTPERNENSSFAAQPHAHRQMKCDSVVQVDFSSFFTFRESFAVLSSSHLSLPLFYSFVQAQAIRHAFVPSSPSALSLFRHPSPS